MNNLKSERAKRGFTQFELAKMSNVSPADISKIERGVTIPFPGWRRKLSNALGVPEKEVFPEVAEGGKLNANG